jgi:hypothetical protein
MHTKQYQLFDLYAIRGRTRVGFADITFIKIDAGNEMPTVEEVQLFQRRYFIDP